MRGSGHSAKKEGCPVFTDPADATYLTRSRLRGLPSMHVSAVSHPRDLPAPLIVRGKQGLLCQGPTGISSHTLWSVPTQLRKGASAQERAPCHSGPIGPPRRGSPRPHLCTPSTGLRGRV
ncbi:hypothetical protein NDU88_001570 [Pleurodeles waltl]|uniref:Uncharacterized protein n=1 Tax=Pleurodeles waltl TaxID=8319 RepID=A0AAV7U780_PLEWA|nr:hypothetical protein NDU88_001570 [Pleurodeles waltl]